MPTYWAGAMSGTSVDGVDAVACAFEGDRFEAAVGHPFVAFPDELRNRLVALQQSPDAPLTLRELASLDQAVAQVYLEALKPLHSQWPLQGIGMHGQTLFHDPDGLATSLQIGNPHVLASRFDCPVVADFRRADMAEGGQGAPLAPAFHRALWHQAGHTVCVVNLGGIANITVLHADGTVSGHDLGPANALMDAWCQQHCGTPFDRDGAWAASGRIDTALFDALAADPWFAQPPPRSTGRGQFNLHWMKRRAPPERQLPPETVQRTLLELTAWLVAEAVQPHAGPLLLCGGGAHNQLLCQRIAERLPGHSVEDTGRHGVSPQWVEAAAFAWLAQARLTYRDSGLPSVTGARRATLQGVVARPATG